MLSLKSFRDMTWNLDRYLEDVYQSSHSWRKIYWRIWGLINNLHCMTCGINFSCSDFTKCPYHKESIVFPQNDPNENCHKPGTFPCCGTKSYKFDPIDPLFLFSVSNYIITIYSYMCTNSVINCSIYICMYEYVRYFCTKPFCG